MILVAGGTGFVGSAVVKELQRRGEAVGVLSRDAARVRALFGDGVAARQADVTAEESLVAAFQGVDVVVNSVQFPRSPIENRRKGWTFEAVDYQGTLHQVDAAKRAGVRRFVYMSGAGAAENADKHWFRFKWQAEQYVQQSGLEWCILRTTWVYGPNDNSLNRILNFGRFLPFIPLFGDGKSDMQPVFIDDVGRIGADAATKPEAANKLFELGGPEVMTMNEVIKTALAAQGKRRPILHQPVFLGKLAGRVASLLPSPPLTADAVDFISRPAVADNSLLIEALQPQLTPFEAGLATYMAR